MKEFVIKEIKPNKYEYGYKIQKLDIKLMKELGIKLPDKLESIYNKGINENELKEYIYFNDPIVVEFIKRQYYIRDYIEYANMNIYELELLLNYYNSRIHGLSNKITKISNKERLNNIETTIKLLLNEMQGLIFLRDNLIDMNKKESK